MVYVCSDIHGNFEVYMKVVNKLSENDKLYILGDVIDRGNDGIKIIQDIMLRDNVELLLGNHEWMMYWSLLTLHATNEFVDNWLNEKNGGEVTLSSLSPLSDNEVTGMMKFLESCSIYKRVETNGVVFNLLHGWYSEDVTESLNLGSSYQLVFDTLWNSPLKKHPINDYNTSEAYIHGHVPILRKDGTVEPFVHDSIVFIDGGLTYGGGLILYCLDTQTYEVIN